MTAPGRERAKLRDGQNWTAACAEATALFPIAGLLDIVVGYAGAPSVCNSRIMSPTTRSNSGALSAVFMRPART